ncbi:MAG: hypothetical protein KF904_14365 [Rhodoblastus sp.]|nr:hypothetical protein [Rhodoblastus sp.]
MQLLDNVVAFPATYDFPALSAYRRRLLTRDRDFAGRASGADAIALERTLDALERVELTIMAMPADGEAHMREKLQIIGRAIQSRADADHIGHLFELARPDMARHPSVAA